MASGREKAEVARKMASTTCADNMAMLLLTCYEWILANTPPEQQRFHHQLSTVSVVDGGCGSDVAVTPSNRTPESTAAAPADGSLSVARSPSRSPTPSPSSSPLPSPRGEISPDHPVVAFLRGANLGQYAEALIANGFDDLETLLDIEDADMMDIGISRGHMVKLKKRLREFRSPEEPVNCAEGRSISERCMFPTDQMRYSVEQSWQRVQAIGSEAISEQLYRAFLEASPDTLGLFTEEVRSKYREWTDMVAGDDESDPFNSVGLRRLFARVINAVGASVAGLHDLNRLVPMLTELGTRHGSYGATEEHFSILGKVLLRVLQDNLAESFTPEVEFAWAMVYEFISAIMVGGLRLVETQIGPRELPLGRGAEICGGREAYHLDQHLQKAVFGDVWEATGLMSGRRFAVKVLDRDMVKRFESLQVQDHDHQFCESPLCEIRYVELMRGLDHVAQLEDHFADEGHHYLVSDLATGGDLLEALRLRPGGFKERAAQMLIREATKGIASLHNRGLAMQDVSLENMLLYVLDDGQWKVRVCDPGQATAFVVEPVTNAEVPVPFRGFVAKDFRPPELYTRREYWASKVDAWCLGWSTFYLMVAQPLFHSADPAAQDPDWQQFRRGHVCKLFASKGWRPTMSQTARDFIMKLLHVNPRQRMSVKEALRHPWLAEHGPRLSSEHPLDAVGASAASSRRSLYASEAAQSHTAALTPTSSPAATAATLSPHHAAAAAPPRPRAPRSGVADKGGGGGGAGAGGSSGARRGVKAADRVATGLEELSPLGSLRHTAQALDGAAGQESAPDMPTLLRGTRLGAPRPERRGGQWREEKKCGAPEFEPQDEQYLMER